MPLTALLAILTVVLCASRHPRQGDVVFVRGGALANQFSDVSQGQLQLLGLRMTIEAYDIEQSVPELHTHAGECGLTVDDLLFEQAERELNATLWTCTCGRLELRSRNVARSSCCC